MDFNRKNTPSLLQLLEQYAASDMVPMHMPGHKRNASAPYLEKLCAGCDITEINGFDDLHDAKGILASAMQRAASLWKSGRTWFLVGGSTCGILAGMRAALGGGGRAVVFRNCHKSVYHALELLNTNVTFLRPQPLERGMGGICGSASPDALKEALEKHPDTALVVLTSPTYEGVISNIAEICRIAHAYGAAVLVDEAHGAHLGFSSGFPRSAVECGADLVVQSLHKTLPSLTQTALLHRNGTLIRDADIERQLDIFETSSPSYLLMSSIDGCVRRLEEQGTGLFAEWERRLAAFDAQIMPLRRLFIPGHGADKRKERNGVFVWDPSKIVIATEGTGISGVTMCSVLRERFHIELEMASCSYAVAMTGAGDTERNTERLADALLALDSALPDNVDDAKPPIPALWHEAIFEPEYSIAEAIYAQCHEVPISDTPGCISAVYLWAYPPGIPILVPGERIGDTLPALLACYAESGVEMKCQPSCQSGMLLCMK